MALKACTKNQNILRMKKKSFITSFQRLSFKIACQNPHLLTFNITYAFFSFSQTSSYAA